MNMRLYSCIKIILLFFLVQQVFRFIMLFYFSADSSALFRNQYALLDCLFYGARFDLRWSLMFSMPCLALFWQDYLFPKKYSYSNKSILFFYTFLFSAIFLLFLADFGTYGYTERRLSYESMHILKSPFTALSIVIESYPIVWIASVWICFSSFLYFTLKKLVFTDKDLLRRFSTYFNRNTPSLRGVRRRVLYSMLFLGVLFFGIIGTNVKQPFSSYRGYSLKDPFFSSMGFNTFQYLLDTKIKEKTIFFLSDFFRVFTGLQDHLKLQAPDPKALQGGGPGKAVDLARILNLFKRPIRETPYLDPNSNIVFIFLESYSDYKTLKNPLNPTPFLKELIQRRNSIFFKNFYASVHSPSSIHGVFSTVMGMPSSIIPAYSLPSLLNFFKKHEKYFFLSHDFTWVGYGLMLKNIDNIHLLGQKHYKYPAVNTWGISDFHLYKEVHRILEERHGTGKSSQDKPFLAFLEGASHHIPYTIPKEDLGFTPIHIDKKTLKKNGFSSTEAFNSLRFADYSLRIFFEDFKKRKDYNKTVFVLFGDHGTSLRDSKNAPDWMKYHYLSHSKVPLVIYSPQFRFKKQKTIEEMTSSVDIMPIMLGMMGIPAENTMLGRNVLHPSYKDSDYVFIPRSRSARLIDQEFLLKINTGNWNRDKYVNNLDAALDPEDKLAELYRYKTKDYDKDIKHLYPKKAKEMIQKALALWQSAIYMVKERPLAQRAISGKK